MAIEAIATTSLLVVCVFAVAILVLAVCVLGGLGSWCVMQAIIVVVVVAQVGQSQCLLRLLRLLRVNLMHLHQDILQRWRHDRWQQRRRNRRYAQQFFICRF